MQRYVNILSVLLLLSIGVSIFSFLYLPSFNSIESPLEDGSEEPVGGGVSPPGFNDTSDGQVIMNAYPVKQEVSPDENGLIKAKAVNLLLNNETVLVHLVVTGEQGVLPANSSNRSARLEPGEERHWSIPVRTYQDYGEAEVVFYYSPGNRTERGSDSHEVRFIQEEDQGSNLLNTLLASGLVTLFVILYIYIINDWMLGDNDESVFTFVQIGLMSGSVFGIHSRRLIVETPIGTGLLLMVVLAIGIIGVEKWEFDES